jgi:hypothetical protein
MTMMFPTVHLNGTSKDELIAQYERAMHDLSAAIDSLRDCAPNARDYYPQSDSAINQAIREHTDRMAKIMKVREEIVSLWESVL